jgi:hypothetical protein
MARTIRGADCKPIESGHAVGIKLLLDDGSTADLRCEDEALSRLLLSLFEAGAAAQRAQSSAPQQSGGLISPLRALDCRSARGADGSVAIQFSTTKGIPVAFAMPVALARKTIQQLEGALRMSPPSSIN